MRQHSDILLMCLCLIIANHCFFLFKCHAKGVAERMLYVRTAHAYVPPDVLVIHTPDVSMYNDTYLFDFTLK